MLYPLLALFATLITWSFTILGSSLVFIFKKTNRNIMDAMLGLAGGVMIAASFWSLLAPSIEIAQSLNLIPWLVVLVSFLSGGLLLFTFDKLIAKSPNINFSSTGLSQTTPANNKSTSTNIESTSTILSDNNPTNITLNNNSVLLPATKRSFMLLFSILLHNIPEGLAIGVAIGSLANSNNDTSLINILLLALGIGIQNFPEGSAISLPLRREGFTRKKAFFYGSLSGALEPVAGLIGALLVVKVNYLLPFLLAFAAGTMIYVVVEEIIPESQTNEHKELMALFSIIGFSIIMVLDVALG